MRLSFSYRLLRIVARALPRLRSGQRPRGDSWRAAVLLVDQWAAATSGDILTVAEDPTADNPRAAIHFPKNVRSRFQELSHIPVPEITATWEAGVWRVPLPHNPLAVTGARLMNELLANTGLGAWGGWEWLDMIRDIASRPVDPQPFMLQSRGLASLVQANRDFAEGPIGLLNRGGRVLVTYSDPRVVTVLSPWRNQPEIPEWVGEDK